jgi:hypothetical protein
MSRQAAFVGFLEYLTRNSVPYDFVTSLYRKLLNRSPDPGGYANWISRLQSGGSPQEVANGLLNSEEFFRAYAKNLYEKYLRREPEEAGWNNWTAALKGGPAQQNANSDLP